VGNPVRQWPASSYAALIDMLSEQAGVNAVLIGTPDEASIGDEILQRVSAKGAAASLIGKVRLAELPALMQACVLFVGNNSGPAFIRGWWTPRNGRPLARGRWRSDGVWCALLATWSLPPTVRGNWPASPASCRATCFLHAGDCWLGTSHWLKAGPQRGIDLNQPDGSRSVRIGEVFLVPPPVVS
jgi:hypothetical protein